MVYRDNYEGKIQSENVPATKLKVKLYKLFSKEMEGFYGYMKLAKMLPEHEDEFVLLATNEYNNAEKVSEIYDENLMETEQGVKSSFRKSMHEDLEKMERHLEEM